MGKKPKEIEHSQGAAASSAKKQALCINCHSEIARNARICPVCKSYQQQWRNTLTYVGGLTSFVVILASAATFIFSQYLEHSKRINWKDRVSLGYAKYPGDITLVNSGDGDMFAVGIEAYWNNANTNTHIALNAIVP